MGKEYTNYCPTRELLSFVSKKWVLLILKSIHDGCKSYSEIEKNIEGTNPRILSARLKELQDFDFIEKKYMCNEAKKSIYCLTQKGKSFTQHIDAMVEWTKRWMK